MSASPTPATRNTKMAPLNYANETKYSSATVNGASGVQKPPRPPPPSVTTHTRLSTGNAVGELPKSRKDKDNMNRRSQCMMQMGIGGVLTDSSTSGGIYTAPTRNTSANLGSAGTSDGDNSSIMSGSITSTR